MPQPCDPISGFERILCTFRACHVERWLVLCCWHRADMACCQGSREKAKSSVEVVQTMELFQNYLREHSGFSVENSSVWDLSLCTCAVFPDCSKGPFLNWSLVSFIFIMLLINKTPHSGLSVIDAYIPFPPLLWLTHIRMVKRGD